MTLPELGMLGGVAGGEYRAGQTEQGGCSGPHASIGPTSEPLVVTPFFADSPPPLYSRVVEGKKLAVKAGPSTS